jgi:hypothetical protein
MTLFAPLLLGGSLAAHALAPVPAPVSVTAEEQALLDKGEIVVRYAGASKPTLAVVDVAAAPDKVMAAVLDLPARIHDIGGLKSVEIYDSSPTGIGARWEMGLALFTATFHIRYELDRAKGWCTYTLDPAKDNDISSSEGSYQVYAQGTGSRLVYRSASSIKGAPDWVKKKLAYSSAREMLGGMKARAEK